MRSSPAVIEKNAESTMSLREQLMIQSGTLPFDSTPYAFPQWLAAIDTSRRSK